MFPVHHVATKMKKNVEHATSRDIKGNFQDRKA